MMTSVAYTAPYSEVRLQSRIQALNEIFLIRVDNKPALVFLPSFLKNKKGDIGSKTFSVSWNRYPLIGTLC